MAIYQSQILVTSLYVSIFLIFLYVAMFQVESYSFHEQGASALLFAPGHNQLVTAGKRLCLTVCCNIFHTKKWYMAK